jgi:hypothetical protein
VHEQARTSREHQLELTNVRAGARVEQGLLERAELVRDPFAELELGEHLVRRRSAVPAARLALALIPRGSLAEVRARPVAEQTAQPMPGIRAETAVLDACHPRVLGQVLGQVLVVDERPRDTAQPRVLHQECTAIGVSHVG